MTDNTYGLEGKFEKATINSLIDGGKNRILALWMTLPAEIQFDSEWERESRHGLALWYWERS